MTFIVKVRGAPSRTTYADYECPVHGRFERAVERDLNGDAPSSVTCELMARHPLDQRFAIRCGNPCEFRISAPLARTPISTVQRGSSDIMPPGALDTRPLADGMSHNEWTRQRRRKRREERLMRLPANVRRVVEKRQ